MISLSFLLKSAIFSVTTSNALTGLDSNLLSNSSLKRIFGGNDTKWEEYDFLIQYRDNNITINHKNNDKLIDEIHWIDI